MIVMMKTLNLSKEEILILLTNSETFRQKASEYIHDLFQNHVLENLFRHMTLHVPDFYQQKIKAIKCVLIEINNNPELYKALKKKYDNSDSKLFLAKCYVEEQISKQDKAFE